MIKRFLLAGLVLLLATTTLTSATEDQFMLFEELEVGMEGVGKTIIRGNEIRSFQVRIIALIDAPGTLNDFIEVRVSGDAIRESGGVAAGMSGSPIYINGKMIGALSRAISFDNSPSPFALITPIGPMLDLIEPTRALASAEVASVIDVEPVSSEAALNGFTELALVDRLPSVEVRELNPDRYYAMPIATPVLVSGLNDRAFDWFSTGLPQELRTSFTDHLEKFSGHERFLTEMSMGLEDRYPIQMINTGLPSGRQTMPIGSIRGIDDLQAGGAIGVTLADGDVSIGALGTVTYRDEDVVLGFGHSFLFTGDVEYFLTRAYIYDTIGNMQVPFKFGVTTERMGTLFQDRFQGIAGMVGTKPDSARMNVRLTNGMTGDVTHYSVDFVQDNRFLASLVFSSGLTLLDRAFNQVGQGTMGVEYTIRGAGLPRRLERRDLFASFNDIAVPGPLQVAQIVFLLAQNEFQDPMIDTIDLDMTFIPEVRTARLVSMTTDKDTYHAGDLVRYTAEFMPYRGENFEVEGVLRLPDGVQSSRVTLSVFGGPRQSSTSSDSSAPVFDGLSEIITLIEEISRNDQLTAEFIGIASDDVEENESISDVQTVHDWVITGEETLSLTIDHSSEESEVETNLQTEEEPEDDAGIMTEEEPEQTEQDDESEEQSCTQLFFC